MDQIFVTKTALPPREEYDEYLDIIWENGYITNNACLLKEFEDKIKHYLGVSSFQFVANGTLALQLAIKALGGMGGGGIITTPFSYVATTNAILWQDCVPVFVDVDEETLCIDPEKIEMCITETTQAILPVHVFGNVCDVAKISDIARKYGLPVIYDAAHAFGVKYRGQSVLKQGDVSICSFHATKLFHTIEGGGIFANEKALDAKIDLLKRFGHNGYDHISEGINAKANEFQAAMGLAMLKHINTSIAMRKRKSALYDQALAKVFECGFIRKMRLSEDSDYNYAYYPVIFKTENDLMKVCEVLHEKGIFPRRYFYPSLNRLPYLKESYECPVSEYISKRILCLPFWHDMDERIIDEIGGVFSSCIRKKV